MTKKSSHLKKSKQVSTVSLHEGDRLHKFLTTFAVFFACLMLFVSVVFYLDSQRLAKENSDLELNVIQLEGQVQALRDKREMEAIKDRMIQQKR